VIATETEAAASESPQTQPNGGQGGAIEVNGHASDETATGLQQPHTILIDGSFLTHRAYHAPIAGEMTNGAGVAVTAVFSYTRSMLKMLRDPFFQADYIGNTSPPSSLSSSCSSSLRIQFNFSNHQYIFI
jgi:hypothetical protein